MTATLRHEEEDIVVILTDDDDVFHIQRNAGAPQVRRFKHPTSGPLLREIARCHPSILAPGEMTTILEQHNRAGHQISKAVLNMRECLKLALVYDLVQNIRGQGYALGNGWTRVDAIKEDNQIQMAINALQQLCEEAVDTIEKGKFRDTPAGIQWVVTNPNQASDNFARFNQAAWHLIQALCTLPHANDAEIMNLKSVLDKLITYVTFRRIANNYREAAWKQDFRKEVNVQVRSIVDLTKRALQPQ